MKIYFLSEVDVPNYKDNISIYSTLSLGKISHVGYYYWILKNSGIKNIELIRSLSEIDNSIESVVFFYRFFCQSASYNNKPYIFEDLINFNCKKIQMVGDTDVVEWANFNFINNPCDTNEKRQFIPFPLPAPLTEKNVNWPPNIFSACSHRFNLNHNFYKERNQIKLKEIGIRLLLEHNKNYVEENFDVFFFLRNKKIYLIKNDDGSLKYPASGYKHPNRLFQSWYMNTPCILNREPQIEYFIKNDLDCLFAENFDEFYEKSLLLRTNKDLYMSMVENYRKKDIPNSNENICKYFVEFFNKQFNFNLK